jgi:MurNAc alpha-1-phosphate uridylyltransferase
MIFAAGRGERMRPLTDTTPKPLLEVGGKRLIEWQLESLAAFGITEVVINTSHLADHFPETLGDGGRWGLKLHFIDEGPIPLETGGGMLNALPLLGLEPFLLMNGDVWSEFDLGKLPENPHALAHLVLVPNPAHCSSGDFVLNADATVVDEGSPRLTYSGIGIYRASLFDGWRSAFAGRAGIEESPPRFALAPLLRSAMHRGKVTGQLHQGRWTDVGTPQRLRELNASLAT